MSSNRIGRINDEIQKELSALLRTVKDPRVTDRMLTITHVDTTSDLRYARIYVSALNCPDEKGLLKGLKSAAGYLRHELGSRIDLRYTHFNEQLLTAGTPGREGDLISAGILLGYSFTLDPCGRWAIDAALALGYQYQDYDRYTWYAPAAQNRLLGTRTHNRFTLTALDVALVYRF